MNSQESAPKSRPGRHARWRALGRFWSAVRWPVIGALASLALVLGYAGFDAHLDRLDPTRSFWDKLYLSLQLFGLESGGVTPPVPPALSVARFLAPLITGYAAISAVASIFREQMARARVRWLARDHVVVVGLGRTGSLLAHEFRRRNRRVVVIEADAANGAIGECREEGATVFVGDARDSTLLASARVDRARYVFAVSDDDGINAQIAIDARERVDRRRGAPLTCFVRVLDVDLAELLAAEMATSGGDAPMRLEFFNPSERGAPALLNEFPPFDDRGQVPAGKPHVLVVGLGQMGSRLVVHAAARWREAVGSDGHPLRVTVIDVVADPLVETLMLRHPHVAATCEVIPLQIDLDSPEFERGDFLFDPDVTSAYVCVDDDARGLGAALRMRRQLAGRAVPVVVRTKRHGGLGALVGGVRRQDENLHVFGLLDITCRPQVLLMGRNERIARAIHEDYVRKQIAEGKTAAENPSMVPWEDLPERLKESNRRQAENIGVKLRRIGCGIEPLSNSDATFAFTPDEVERLAHDEHERWWRERLADDWTLAPEKNVERKQSPYLVEWEQLSEEIREYDRNAVRGIPAFLARAGLRVVSREGRHGSSE